MSWFFMGLMVVLIGASLAVLIYSLHVWIEYRIHEWAFAAVLSFLSIILFGQMLVGTWGAIHYERTRSVEMEAPASEIPPGKFQIVETTEGKFIPYENSTILGQQCVGSDGFRWNLKYEDEYCIYDDEKSARRAIYAYLIRYQTDYTSKHTPQRVIGVE